jgi:hypothetical protein
MKKIFTGLGLLVVAGMLIAAVVPPSTGGGSGTGDMTKAVYDADDNGIIDAAALPVAGTGDFLADGTVPMTGPLNFAQQDATNIMHLEVEGNATVATNLTAGKQLLSPNFVPISGSTAAAITNGMYSRAANNVNFAAAGYEQIEINSGGLTLQSGLHLDLDGAYIGFGETEDTYFYRDAANTLAQRNGTISQTNRIYGTYTDASNYERLSLYHDGSGDAFVVAGTAGTGGDDQNLNLGTAGAGSIKTSAPLDFNNAAGITNAIYGEFDNLSVDDVSSTTINATTVNAPNWNAGVLSITNMIRPQWTEVTLDGTNAVINMTNSPNFYWSTTTSNYITFSNITEEAQGCILIYTPEGEQINFTNRINNLSTNRYAPVFQSTNQTWIAYSVTFGTDETNVTLGISVK